MNDDDTITRPVADGAGFFDEPLRKPPHSVEAEQSVLGALLLDNTAFDSVADLVTDRDFFLAEHREAFATIAALINAGRTADIVTVTDQLKREGWSDRAVGGMKYLNAMVQSVPSAAGARRYAEIVRERSLCRALIAVIDEAGTVARDDAVSIADRLDRIDRLLDRVRGSQVRKGPVQLADLLVQQVDRISELHQRRGEQQLAGMPTGIPPLDRLLGGLQAGKLVVLAARPSVGKSSAARHVGISAAEAGHPTLMLSMEMPGSEIAACVIAQLGEIDSDRISRADLGDDEWGRLAAATDRGSRMPLFVDDEGGLTLAGIRNKARMVKGLRLLIVDYLQLSTSTLRGATTNDQIAEVSKGLKALALSMGISIVLLSQLNREVERRADKEPMLSDLRDSGAIEQDADIAVLLWTAREFDGGATRVVGWKVAKHRGGPRGRFAMQFDAPRYAWSPAPVTALEAPSRTEQRGFE